jgi:hypothetical protein
MINKKIKYITFFILILLTLLPFSNAIIVKQEVNNNEKTILQQIQDAIIENNAEWTAGETKISSYSQDQLKILFGGKLNKPSENYIEYSPPLFYFFVEVDPVILACTLGMH